MGEAHVHVFGDDYLLEREGWEWLASVPCVCGAGARPTAPGPTDWHWHEVARAETFTDLMALLSVRQVLEAAEAA
jgi:hypothetical protein